MTRWENLSEEDEAGGTNLSIMSVYRSYHTVTIWHVTLYQANWCWTAKDYLRQHCALTVKTPACSLIAAASAYLALRC